MSQPDTNAVFQAIVNAAGGDAPAETASSAEETSKTEGENSGEASSATSASSSGEKPSYPPPAMVLTQAGPDGIRFDFNNGIRVSVPEGRWRVRFTDLDAGVAIFDGQGEACLFQSRKRHFLRAKIEVFKEGKLVFEHSYDARGKKVAVILPGGTVGDSIAWFPYAERFGQVHGSEMTVMLSPHMKQLLEPAYPHVRFVEQDDFDPIASELYATYYIGLFFSDEDNTWQPSDFRLVGLHKTAAHILGVSPAEQAPALAIEGERPVKEPYVVIACQASTQCKYWNNPHGWLEVVDHLRNAGYRVICIDKDPIYGQGMHWNHIPHGAEDETGTRPLRERALWLKHAEFFIGLSSGLSWLAWAAGTPVVMISGFTHPLNEFETPHRIFSTHVCNSCWHDVRHPFVHSDFLFCPRHANTPRQFECTRAITSRQVIQSIAPLIANGPFGKKPETPASN